MIQSRRRPADGKLTCRSFSSARQAKPRWTHLSSTLITDCRIYSSSLRFLSQSYTETTMAPQLGPGDFLLGVKWRFFNDEQAQVQLGVYPQVLLPTGDESRGLGEDRTASVLPLLVRKSWEKWMLYGN